MSKKAVEEMSFEEAINEFDRVVKALEGEEVPLEESITLYQRGVALKERCDEHLKSAAEKIAAITSDSEGNPTGTQPLDVD